MAKKEKESPSTSLDYLHWWEDNTKPKQPHTFGNTINAIKSGIGNAYDMVDIDRELNSLWEEYNVNPNTTPERKKEIESLFVDKYKQAKALAQEQQDKVDWLQEDQGTLSQLGSHAFSAGTSLNSMAMQYGIQGTSALLGGIVGGVLATPETGGLGTLAGAKAGASAGWNASALPSSIIANYQDANDAAAAVRERVMKATGNAALAQQAYEEARLPNLAAVAPSVIVDALTSKYVGGAIGKLAGKGAKVGKAANRMADMMEAARQTRLARGLQRVADTPLGTMAGRAANFIDEFDLPQKAGSWVAGKTNIPALGKLTRGALQFAGEEASEVFQEGEQGISEDTAYENALYKSDPTKYAKPEGWTANRISNWVNSEEGRRTIVDTLVGTGLTAGLATGVSGFARLDDGYNNRNNLRNVDNILAEQQEGGILYSADPEVNSQMKNTIGARYHLNEEQTSALSPEQVIRLSLEDESERAQASGMSAEEASTYAINKYINKRLGFAGRPDYTSEASERFFSKYGIKGTEGLTSIEKRRQEEQEVLKQQPTVAAQAHPDTFNNETGSVIQKRLQQNSQGVEQGEQGNTSVGILSKLPQVWHDNWVRREVATTGTNDEYENNTALYDNKVTGKVVRITEMNGQLFVSDVTPKNTKDAEGNPVDAAKTNKFGSPVSRGSRGGQKFTMNKKGLEALNKFFLDNKTNVKELSQESDEQQQAALPPDPNRRRVLIWSANDLANFYRNNSDLMSEDTFMKMTDVLMAYGNNNIPIDLDLERDNNGIVGQTTSEPVQQGVIRAVVHLYMGADAITVLHEFAHVGYDMKSEHEKKLFNAMAQMTQEGFVADVLRKSFNYYADKTNDEIFAMIRQAVQTKDGNVWKDIQSAGVLRQTINIINNEADPDKIQEACEERYAWEFTLWYAEGYLKGRKPDNRMTAMLQRDCRTLGKALKLIGSVAERLQSNGWQAVSGKSMVSMFEEMNNRLYETGDPNVRRTYGGLSRQVQGGYQLNPEIFNNPERRMYTNPLETAMPYSPQVTSMPMQFGTQSQMQMPYNPQATTMPMNYGNPMENTMQQSVPQQAQSMPFGAEMQMANAYPNNTYVPNFTSNIPNFQLQSNPEEGIQGARQNLKDMSNRELTEYAESLRGVDPYSFERQQVMEEMNRRGLSGKFARREENREVGAYTGEPTSREIMKPETIADMGDAEMNALADMLIEQYNSNLKELGRLMDTSYENAEGDPATQRFIERLRKVVFDKLYDRNRRGMPEGSRQEETQERGEPEKTKVVVHRNKYTQVSDAEAGKILNKAEHGDEEAKKQWESLPFNQRRRVKGEADITEQQMKEQTKKAAETGKPTYTTGKQMREGLQANPLKESRPHELSDALENARRSGIRDIVRKISEMSPEEREKYLQDPKFEENPNYKQAKEIYLESLKPHQALRGKKGELIGRQIESVTRSKIAVEMIEEAFPDGLPTDLSEWRDITSSSNVDGEKGWQIYNKLFNAGIKQSQLDGMSIIVHRSGLVGCVITKSGRAFPTVLNSNKYKEERSGLLSQMLLMLHAMPKVKTLTVSTSGRSANDMLGQLYIYRRAGFDIVGQNLQDGKIYLRNSNIEGAIKTKGDKLKWKGLAVGRFREKHEDIKLGRIPQFRNQQELNDYYDGLSEKEEPMTRKQQRNIWDSVNRAVVNFPMTSDKQLRQLIKMVDDKLQTKTSSSKMLSSTKLLYNLLKGAAEEELNSRKGKYNYSDESTILNSLFGAEELKERREEMKKEGRVATDQFKAQELFDDATARFTQEEDEALNAPTEADEPFADKHKTNKDSFAIEEISADSFDRLIQSAKPQGKEAEELAKKLKDAFFELQEGKRNGDPEEKLQQLESSFLKIQKAFTDMASEFQKKIEEAVEEYDKEETDALIDEKQADKKGASTVRVADDSLRGDITKYNYDDLCRIAMADLLVGEEGKETLYKGLSEDEYITPTEVRRIIGALGRKYDSPNIEGIREGLIFRELTESEKRQVGRVFRKLYRMKKLMDGRFKQGLYGQRGSANSEEWHIFGHAFAFRRWFSGFYAGNAYGFNALKKIMDNNDIPMYLYAFDEKDMATPLSDEQANSYRKKIKTITKELTQLRSKRLSEKNNAKKVEYDRQIATRENERMEMMTQLWAHGKDINGDGSYSAEDEIFNRDARQRNWVRKFGYKLGRIDLKKKPRQQTTEQEQKELNEEINKEINNKPKEESPLSRKIVVNINSDNVERARIATEKRNREEQAVADKEWEEKKSAEEQELYDYMNGNQEVMSFLKKPIKKPEDILRFNAMNTIAENTSEETLDRVKDEMDKFLEDLRQMGVFGSGDFEQIEKTIQRQKEWRNKQEQQGKELEKLGVKPEEIKLNPKEDIDVNSEEYEGYRRYTQIKNKLNEQLEKVRNRITGKTQPKQTKQKKQTTATESKQTAQTNTAEQGATIDDSKLNGRILQAIKHYYKTGEIDMSKIIYDGETVTPEQQKTIDSRLANAKKKYAEKNKGNAEPAPTPTPEPTTNKKNATNKKNKSTKTTQPKQQTAQQAETVALTDSKLGGRLMQAEKRIKANGELGDYKVVHDDETVTAEQQKKIDKRLENARKAYEKSKGATPATETPATPEAETTTKNETNKSATKNKKTTSKKNTPATQPQQNPQPVAQPVEEEQVQQEGQKQNPKKKIPLRERSAEYIIDELILGSEQDFVAKVKELTTDSDGRKAYFSTVKGKEKAVDILAQCRVELSRILENLPESAKYPKDSLAYKRANARLNRIKKIMKVVGTEDSNNYKKSLEIAKTIEDTWSGKLPLKDNYRPEPKKKTYKNFADRVDDYLKGVNKSDVYGMSAEDILEGLIMDEGAAVPQDLQDQAMDKIQKKLDSLNSKTRNQEVDYPNNTKTRNMAVGIEERKAAELEKDFMKKFRHYLEKEKKSAKFFQEDEDWAEEGENLNFNTRFSEKQLQKLLGSVSKIIKHKTFYDRYGVFLGAFDRANGEIWRESGYRYYRGLDGKWREWISDDGMQLKLQRSRLPKKEKKTTLENIIDHDLLFEKYPELRDFNIILGRDGNDGAFAVASKNYIRVNLDRFNDSAFPKDFLNRVLLHEIQHVIQDKEGFAKGGGLFDFAFLKEERKNAREAMQEIVDRSNDFIGDVISYAEEEEEEMIRNGAIEHIVRDAYRDLKKDLASLRNNKQQLSKELDTIVDGENPVSPIGEYIANYLVKERDLPEYVYLPLYGEIEARDTMDRYNAKSDYEKYRQKLREYNKQHPDRKNPPSFILGIHREPTNPKATPISTEEYYKNGTLIIRMEEPQLPKSKSKKNNSKTRNMEVDTIPETPVEQNRDVYSITFTKDALAESEENRKRAKNYESEDKYWKKEKNADGSVTFTRQKPQPHHTKTITYSGMHGKEVSKKPLTTVSEGLSKVWDYWKEKAYNVQASIKDLAEMVGAPESWMEFVVTKDMGSLAATAIERGIVKHNSKDKERTVALMDIANAFKGEKEQWNFINYCVAYRVLHDLTPKGIEQKMKPNEARDIIRQVESSPDAAKYKEWREKFTEYNKELLHVLVDGNMITEQEYQTLIKEHPNFIPLSKDMSDFDGAMDFLHTHRDLINVQSPLHRIGTDMKEIKNPIMEMQKRTLDYYQRAAQNKAALVFIDKIVNKITTLANGDEVMLNQAILHKLKPQYNKNGTIKDISDANKGIFYVMRNGKKEFYQLSDASVYKALRAMSPQHMEGFGKFVDFAFRKPSQLLRTMATITFDFAIGNLVRDTGEAFVTSRHGFVPFYDSLWGMWQMYNDTQWFKEYNSQVGDMTSRLKEDKRIAGVEETIEDQLIRIPVLGHMARAMKTFNDYMEQGTRIGEYKNARMGYKGLAGRLSKDGVGWITDKDLQKAEKSQTYAAYRAKDITLNFLQRGEWGGWINRYTTFFNAAMQGQYKIIDTLSEIKNNREGFRNEMLLKASLIAFLGFMTGYNGGDDDDYEEAPDWERDNYYIQGNGLRTPKDQLFGKLIGNPFEQLGYMMKKGKLKNDAFKTFEGTIKEFMLPDNLTPVLINLWLGLSGGKDSFKGKQIVPEYMKEKIGYLQKDLSTSNMAADISRFAYDYFGIDVSAKKLDWGLKQFMSNTAKYVDKIYDTGREEITGEKNNRSGHMYLEEDSKGASDYLNFTTGNNILDGILDLGRMAFGKKFIQNQTTYDSMQDFNEEYLRLKRLSSDEERFTKEDEKKYKTFYEPAFKKIKENYQKLSAISKDRSLDPDKKTEKQRPIVKQSIDLARWALEKGGK